MRPIIPMTIADEIIDSINTNRITPSRAEVKRMVNNNRWDELGRAFGFTPVFHFDGASWIDWRCVPLALQELLRDKPRVEKPFAIVKDIKVQKRKTGKTQNLTRHLLFEKQAGICHYCLLPVERRLWTIEHRQPLARGGTNLLKNKIGACKACNSLKSCLTEEEFMLFAEYGKDGSRSFPDRAAIKRMVFEIQKRIL